MYAHIPDVDEDWAAFMRGEYADKENAHGMNVVMPEEQDLYQRGPLSISTKTKIAYLNKPVDLSSVFWALPVLPYACFSEGVVKKQMKFSAASREECDELDQRLGSQTCGFKENIVLTDIDNPGGRVPFKHVRKTSIGLCKKDLINFRSKKRSAFYNCFVVILRLWRDGQYREIHVKVFNTGKLEIPGIQSDALLGHTLSLLIDVLRPFTSPDLDYVESKTETVLINSNFSCGYLVNRDYIHDVMQSRYKLNCAYDPCSYPGIQCEFYYDPRKPIQDGIQPTDHADPAQGVHKVSFMIFRTGSVLIVGKCTEAMLDDIYDYVASLLENEAAAASEGPAPLPTPAVPKERRKRLIKVAA